MLAWPSDDERTAKFVIACGAAIALQLLVWGGFREEYRVALTCPSCGNDRNFLVKTLQMHVVHLEDSRVEVSEESRPAVLEVLCDECETALNFEEFEDTLRREVLLTIGAR